MLSRVVLRTVEAGAEFILNGVHIGRASAAMFVGDVHVEELDLQVGPNFWGFDRRPVRPGIGVRNVVLAVSFSEAHQRCVLASPVTRRMTVQSEDSALVSHPVLQSLARIMSSSASRVPGGHYCG